LTLEKSNGHAAWIAGYRGNPPTLDQENSTFLPALPIFSIEHRDKIDPNEGLV
jgi:hypothetical protein